MLKRSQQIAIFVPLLAATAIVVGAETAAADPVTVVDQRNAIAYLDANFAVAFWSDQFTTSLAAQTFRVGVTGMLTGIDLLSGSATPVRPSATL